MPDVTPVRYTSAATPVDRSIVRPAQGMGDQHRQVSWLTAQTLHDTFPAFIAWR